MPNMPRSRSEPAEFYTKRLSDTAQAISHAGMSFDQSERTLVFYACRFNMPRGDAVGDTIDGGAFDSWFRRWSADPEAEYPATHGRLLVVISHAWEIERVIGYAEPADVTIDSRGLLVAAHLFDTEEAKRVWNLASPPPLGIGGIGASFAYSTPKRERKRTLPSGEKVNEIMEFDEIFEVGPCVMGAEKEAGTIGVHAADRAIAEYKSLEAQVHERHPELILREIAGYVAAARAKKDGSHQPPLWSDTGKAGREVNPADMGPGNCPRCGQVVPAFVQTIVDGTPFGYPFTECQPCSLRLFHDASLVDAGGKRLNGIQVFIENERIREYLRPPTKSYTEGEDERLDNERLIWEAGWSGTALAKQHIKERRLEEAREGLADIDAFLGKSTVTTKGRYAKDLDEIDRVLANEPRKDYRADLDAIDALLKGFQP